MWKFCSLSPCCWVVLQVHWLSNINATTTEWTLVAPFFYLLAVTLQRMWHDITDINSYIIIIMTEPSSYHILIALSVLRTFLHTKDVLGIDSPGPGAYMPDPRGDATHWQLLLRTAKTTRGVFLTQTWFQEVLPQWVGSRMAMNMPHVSSRFDGWYNLLNANPTFHRDFQCSPRPRRQRKSRTCSFGTVGWA